MAYTTPPTFVTGAVLSAAQLNTLSDNQEYLYGAVTMTNPAVQMVEITAGDSVTATATKWAIRHRTNTLKYRMDMVQGTSDGVRIKFGSTTVFNDSSDRNTPYSFDSTVDISSAGLTVGTWYVVTVELDGEPGSAVNRLQVIDLREIA